MCLRSYAGATQQGNRVMILQIRKTNDGDVLLLRAAGVHQVLRMLLQRWKTVGILQNVHCSPGSAPTQTKTGWAAHTPAVMTAAGLQDGLVWWQSLHRALISSISAKPLDWMISSSITVQ